MIRPVSLTIVILSLAALVGCGKKSVEAPPVPAMATPSPKAVEAREVLARAVDAQMARKYPEAEALFAQAILLDSSLKGVTYQRAVVAFNRGDEPMAAKFAYQAIAEGESQPQAYNLLGTMAARRQDYPTAEWAFDRAVAAGPADPMAFYNWSEALRAEGKSAAAIEKLRAAIQRNPGEPLFALKLRLAQIEGGDYAALVPDVDRELALKPPSADWLITAAAISLKVGRDEDASRLLNSARASMQPVLFFGLIQEDPFFRKFKDSPSVAPFHDVQITVKAPPTPAPATPAAR